MKINNTVISLVLLSAYLLGTSVGAMESTSTATSTSTFKTASVATESEGASEITIARSFSLKPQHLHESELSTKNPTQTNTALETDINTQVTLADLQWKNRLIIAFAVDVSDQIDVLRVWVESHACELNDRDLLVFALTDNRSTALNYPAYSLDLDSIQRLNKRRQHKDEPFELILIGKDGGIKANATSATAMQNMIKQIDGMPMRRSEASGQSGACK